MPSSITYSLLWIEAARSRQPARRRLRAGLACRSEFLRATGSGLPGGHHVGFLRLCKTSDETFGRRLDEARRDRVHADSSRPHFIRQPLLYVVNAALADRVRKGSPRTASRTNAAHYIGAVTQSKGASLGDSPGGMLMLTPLVFA